jgi:hypothetical protein
MKNLGVLLLLLVAGVAFAKSHEWHTAKVDKFTTTDSGTAVAVVPIGGGLYGASVPQRASFYWIKTDKITYVIHNYSEGAFIKPWLILTIGGPVDVFIDGRYLHVKDTEGKDRKCKILQQVANTTP